MSNCSRDESVGFTLLNKIVAILQHEMHVEYFEWVTERKMQLSRQPMWIPFASPSRKKLVCSVSQITAGCSPLFPWEVPARSFLSYLVLLGTDL